MQEIYCDKKFLKRGGGLLFNHPFKILKMCLKRGGLLFNRGLLLSKILYYINVQPFIGIIITQCFFGVYRFKNLNLLLCEGSFGAIVALKFLLSIST